MPMSISWMPCSWAVPSQAAASSRVRVPALHADVVTAELAAPGRERSAIGRLAADLLETAGWRP
jgi:hypothetical protein